MAAVKAPPKLEKKPVKFSNLLRRCLPHSGMKARLHADKDYRCSWCWFEHVRVRIYLSSIDLSSCETYPTDTRWRRWRDGRVFRTFGADGPTIRVTTLGQPLEVVKTTMAANRTDSFAGAMIRIWGRGGVLGCKT